MKMTLKPDEQSQQINDVIAGKRTRPSAWRNHPGFDPDTQWVWWHCNAAPAQAGAGTDVAEHRRRDGRRHGRQQLRQPRQLQPVQRPDDQQGVRDRPHEHRPGGAQDGLRGPSTRSSPSSSGTAWGYWTRLDRSVPDQRARDPRTEPPDRDVARRDGRRREPVHRACRAAPTCRRSGSKSSVSQRIKGSERGSAAQE